MTTIYLYKNIRNPNKIIEVRDDGYSHNAVRQFMFWKENKVKNMTGDGYLHRWRRKELDMLLKDYIMWYRVPLNKVSSMVKFEGMNL